MDKIIPELSITDMERSLEFYTALGFEKTMDGHTDDKGLQWCALEHQDSSVWLLRRDTNSDFRPDEKAGNGVTIYLRVDNVDEAYRSVTKAGLHGSIVKELETHWYGLREFQLADPDGYVWTYYTPAPEGDQTEDHPTPGLES